MKPTKLTRQRMAAAKLGTKLSPEHRQRISDGMKTRHAERTLAALVAAPRRPGSPDTCTLTTAAEILQVHPPRHLRTRRCPASAVAPRLDNRVFMGSRAAVDAYVRTLTCLLPARHYGDPWPNGVAEFITWSWGQETAVLHGWRTVVGCVDDDGPGTHHGSVNVGGVLRACREQELILNPGTPENWNPEKDVAAVAMVIL